jgi:hypothetical protein
VVSADPPEAPGRIVGYGQVILGQAITGRTGDEYAAHGIHGHGHRHIVTAIDFETCAPQLVVCKRSCGYQMKSEQATT